MKLGLQRVPDDVWTSDPHPDAEGACAISARRGSCSIDSAEFFEDELQGFTADVVCLCAIGRR